MREKSSGHQHFSARADGISLSSLTLSAAAINIIFVGIELIMAAISHSTSLAADAAHNLLDVVGILFVWWSEYLVKHRRPKQAYTYGYKPFSILSALVNTSLIIFIVLFVTYESVLHIVTPTPPATTIMMITASAAFLVNLGTALLFVPNMQKDINIKGVFLHLLGDSFTSLGVVFAALLVRLTGVAVFDPIMGLIIVATILLVSRGLFKETYRLIMNAAPYDVDPEKVREFICKQKGVYALHDLHVWRVSTRETVITAHIALNDDVQNTFNLLEALHWSIAHTFPVTSVTLQLERSRDRSENGEHCIFEHIDKA